MRWYWQFALLLAAPVLLNCQMQMGGPAATLKDNVLRHSARVTKYSSFE